jgi:GDPmannose 4,6-dehydratase
VEDILRIAFESVGLEWRDHVETDPKLFRAADPTDLVGNPSKARRDLGWESNTPFEQLFREMTCGS